MDSGKPVVILGDVLDIEDGIVFVVIVVGCGNIVVDVCFIDVNSVGVTVDGGEKDVVTPIGIVVVFICVVLIVTDVVVEFGTVDVVSVFGFNVDKLGKLKGFVISNGVVDCDDTVALVVENIVVEDVVDACIDVVVSNVVVEDDVVLAVVLVVVDFVVVACAVVLATSIVDVS